ncbi:MAG: DUF1343 domain-containing protein [Candidatus Latescibacteria bacterium]|nr:DUF1343 domain-containing protein [bacterium]MBD3424659.1 DUF1343 domain-containing protein [Candidatus Latescibacterota bacterium]
MVLTGSERIASGDYLIPEGTRAALLANPASVSSFLAHTADILIRGGISLKAVFGPQHGFRGETQANMIEWASYTDPATGIPVYSLYGEQRSPTTEMLEGIELMVIDLQDVGTRCYTYIWTAVLMMEKCAGLSIPVLVLDRPNPIGGESVEGPLIDEDYFSFVGLFPLPIRHGLTMAEILKMVNQERGIGCSLQTVCCRGWSRDIYFRETGLPWILPSPNMPSPDTALLYPGTVMLEGTNISEGRGTTLPFQIIGAPFIDPAILSEQLSARELAGAAFRPVYFKPTWDKYTGEVCGGVQIHVLDREIFQPVRTGVHIIDALSRICPDHFQFIPPPYEYEEEHMPIDIISGGDRLRRSIQRGFEPGRIFEEWEDQEKNFTLARERFTIY